MKKEKGYWIEVQIPQRKVVLAKGDHIIKIFPVAVGMPSWPSPTGFRKINTIIWNPWWTPPRESKWVTDPTPVPPRVLENPLGEIKMPLGENYLIHGTRAADSIGHWASHGCIRMIFEDLFSLVQILMTDYSSLNAIETMEKANRDQKTQFATPLNSSIPVVLNYNPVVVHNDYVTISPDFYNHVPNMVTFIAEKITPTLKKGEEPSLKKIKNILRMFKQDTIQVPIANLVKEGETDEAKLAELEKKEIEKEKKKKEKEEARLQKEEAKKKKVIP